MCRTWTFTRGHKRDATSERGAAFSSQSPKAGHWTPRAKVYIQIPGHLTSTMLNFLQYIRLCHIQISGQMQTPKVFLLLSCILHQYRTSAKAFSSRPTSRKVQRNSSVENLAFLSNCEGRVYLADLISMCFGQRPVFYLIIVTCKSFVSSPVISWQARCQFHPLYATNSAPPPSQPVAWVGA